MTWAGIVRFILITNCRSRMLGLGIMLLLFCWIRLTNLNITPFRIIIRWRWNTFLSSLLPFRYIFICIFSCVDKQDVLDDDPSDEFVSFRYFYTDLAAIRATNCLYLEDCTGGMYLDSGRLYSYVKIRTVRISSRMKWFGRFGMLEHVPNPPVPSHISSNCHTPYAWYESISTNFPESIREDDS